MTVAVTTACVASPEVFLHPLLEEALPSNATGEQRRQHGMLTAVAARMCGSCPRLASCLYAAVVRHDASGFVAGTTARQRQQIRTRLRVTVEPEDFDTLAGVHSRNRQIDHDEVVRLRNANPHESLEVIAMRLGCSLSTVKRHLRKARAEADAPKLAAVPPSVEQVMQAYGEIVAKPTTRSTRAA